MQINVSRSRGPIFSRLSDNNGGARYVAIVACVMAGSGLYGHDANAADLTFGGAAPYTATVGAWWTPFYDQASTSSAQNWSGTRWDAYYKDNNNNLQLGHYDSSNSNNVDFTIQQMQSVGIQFALSDLTNGVGIGKDNTELFLDRGEAAPQMFSAAAAIGGPLWANTAGKSDAQINAEANLEADTVWGHFVHKGTQFPLDWSNQPRPNYIQYQGNPLMITYMNYDGGKANVRLPYWYDSRFTIGRATGLIDPANPDLDPVANGYNWDAWWGWHSKDSFPSNTAMTVSPGFDTCKDDTVNGCQFRDPGVFLDRRDGQEYMEQWISSIVQDPDVIMIASWNDYGEENHIEPSEPDGSLSAAEKASMQWKDINGNPTSDIYAKITSAYTALKDNRLLEGYFYKDESSSSIYRVDWNSSTLQSSLTYIGSLSQIPANAAVVTLPGDWLTQIRVDDRIVRGGPSQVPEPGLLTVFVISAGAVILRRSPKHNCPAADVA